MIEEKIGSLVVYRWKIFEPWRGRFTAALTTRLGAGDAAPLHGLNLAYGVNDDSEIVLSSRRRVSEALEMGDAPWALCRQVHGTDIAAAAPAADGTGVPSPYDSKDGIYIEHPRIAAAVFLADCHPVILYDPVRHAAAALHAGWRGTVGGIAAAGVKRMLEGGSRIENLTAATGPGIGACCYRVGENVGRRFRESFGAAAGFTRGPSESRTWYADIEEANAAALKKAGLKSIGRARFCTACRTDRFFSYRAEHASTGRQAAVVMLR